MNAEAMVMIGTTHSPSGDQGRRIQAAQDWLRRAEDQFDAGQAISATATLMLAQAELKLAIEAVASGVKTSHPVRKSNPFKLAPILRTVATTSALAACLLIGIIAGRISAPNPGPANFAPVGIPMAQVPNTGQPEQQFTIPEQPDTGAESVASESTGPESAGTSPSHYRRPNISHQAPIDAVENVKIPEPPSQPSPVISPLPESPIPVDNYVPAKVFVHPAEVALETIRAISERLLEEEKKK
jgi:hypothetical protein